MVTACLAVAGLFISLYLWLWKLGLIGVLACGTGGCEYVQTSRYAVLFGVPVAAYGVAGYVAVLGLSLVGLHGRWAERPEPTRWLAVLAGAGVAFSAYLTYLEAAVIHAWCRWCLASAAVITAVFVTALFGLRAGARHPS